MRNFLFSIATSMLVVGCGGGGTNNSSGPPATASPLSITAANYQAVAQESMASTYYLTNTAALVTGAQITNEQVLIAFARFQADRLQHWFRSVPRLVTGATIVQTEFCSGGGSITITLEDLNNNNDIDAGESATLVANQCVEFGATVSGTLSAAVNTLTGDLNSDVYSLGLTIGLSNLSAALSGGTVTGNGSMTVNAAFVGANRGTIAVTVPTATMTGSFGGVNYTRSTTNFSITDTRTPSGFDYVSSIVISGAFTSSSLESKSVTLATVSPVVRQGSSRYPASGQITATGLNASRARLTAQNVSTVLIELDANGDGVYEQSVSKLWSELL